jgi:hypothetical protein
MASQAANRLSRSHRRQLSALSTAVASGVTSVALGADPTDIDTWYLGALDGLITRVVSGHAQARRMSTDYLRRHSAIEGHPVTPVPASLNLDQVRTSLRVTGPVAFKQAVTAGQDPAQAVRTMATRLSGSASRLTLAGDRDTLHATAFAREGIVGYRRVLGGPGCGFCAMLASRGAVYLTEASAARAKDGTRYHDHCRCTPVPLYAHEDEPADVRALQRQWQRATVGRRGNDAVRAWRRHWEGREAVKRDQLALAAAEVGAGSGAAGAVTAVAVRSALQSAGTVGAVGRAFRAEYARITGRKIPSATFHGDVVTAREHAEGLLRGVERFPGARLIGVGPINDTAAAAVTQTTLGGGYVRFSDHWTQRRPEYLDALGKDVADGFHPTGTASPVAIAIHEFGHVLDIGTLGEAIRPDLNRLLFRRATERDKALDALRAAGQPISAEDFVAGMGATGLIRREVSSYALKNQHELVAEAFGDVMMNGARASRLSREIVDLLEAEYRRGTRRSVVVGSAPAELDLAKMTVVQLRALAKSQGLKGYSKMVKADLVKALSPAAPVKKAAKAAPKRPTKSTAAKVARGDFSGLKPISGGTTGTNPGGRYRADDGSIWFVKSVTDEQHLNNEVLAAALYRAAGIDMPEIVRVKAGNLAPGLVGQWHIASRVDPKFAGHFDPSVKLGLNRKVSKLGEGYAVDAWLANWDVMGAGFGNIGMIAGRPVRLDVGGSLIFRGGVGLPKGPAFGDTVPERLTLRDPKRSSHAARVYGKLTQEELRASVARVQAITPAKIRALVRSNGMSAEIATRLIARRADLIKQLDREFAKPIAAANIVKARDKFDARLAVAKTGQDGLDQSPLRMIGDSSHNITFEGSWARQLGVDVAEVQLALKRYRGDAYEDINGVLRGKMKATQRVNQYIDSIEKAVAKSKLRDEVTVWRGVRTGESVFGSRASWPDDLTGAEWTDPAFFSTSVDRGKAEGFAGAVLMRFVFPKGTPAIQLSGYEYEAELMIGAGYRFRVIRDRGEGKSKFGKTIDRILDVEVIPPKRATGTKVP